MSNKVKVCLDAGHVGSKYNQSPVVKNYYESAMVWSLHLKLKAALEALPQVDAAEVSLEDKQATLHLNAEVSDEAVRAAVEQAVYTVGK